MLLRLRDSVLAILVPALAMAFLGFLTGSTMLGTVEVRLLHLIWFIALLYVWRPRRWRRSSRP